MKDIRALFEKRTVRILLFGTEGTYVVSSVKALLPLQFTGETMNE